MGQSELPTLLVLENHFRKLACDPNWAPGFPTGAKKMIAPDVCNLGVRRKSQWHCWYSPLQSHGGSPAEEGGDEGHTQRRTESIHLKDMNSDSVYTQSCWFS